jgi:uncharacterized protein HemY
MSDQAIKRMANQIAANLKNRSDANSAITQHLKSFWTPKMISELKELAQKNQAELDELIIEVLPQI